MAYADADRTGRKFGAGATVIALEVGIAWAIIAALSLTVAPTEHNRLITYKLPDEPKPVPPPPQPTSEPVHAAAPTPRDPLINVLPTTAPTFVPMENNGGDLIAPVPIPSPLPVPIPVPSPSFTAKAARPAGNTAGWVTTDDYPTSDLRAEHKGSVRYRLSLDAAGKPTGCSIVASSGHPGLDQAACDKLMRRARFTPASDETGARVAGSFTGTVTWRLPEE